MNNMLKIVFMLLLLIIFTASCSRTKTLQVWKAEEHTRPLHTVLVIAAAQEEFLREMFEKVLTQKLEKLNIQAIPSYTIFPDLGKKLDKEAILSKAKELGAESILLTRSVSQSYVKDYQPGTVRYAAVYSTNKDWTFYGQGFVRPVEEKDTQMYHIVTNLYDTAQVKLVWSTVSQVWVESSREVLVKPFVDNLLTQFKNDKLIP